MTEVTINKKEISDETTATVGEYWLINNHIFLLARTDDVTISFINIETGRSSYNILTTKKNKALIRQLVVGYLLDNDTRRLNKIEIDYEV